MEMSQEGDTERHDDLDEVLKTALAMGRSYAESGALVHVSARTVRRRMADPDFAAEVSRRRAEHVGALTGQMVAAGQEAVTVLLGCLAAENESVRLRAAQMVLSLSAQMRHAGELEDRLVALETTGLSYGEGRRS